MQTKTVHAADTATDVLPLLDVDHLEFYVGNAKQAAYYYRAAFGFQLAAYAGPETGVRDRASYLVEQGRIRIVLTTPLRSDHPIGEQIRTHGDTVRDVALEVVSAERSYQEALGRGARGVREPVTLSDSHGEVRLARRPHGGQRRLGRDERLGEVLRRRDGVQALPAFRRSDISTEYSALMSKVMANGNGRVKFPINEPAEGRRKSQIEEYLDFYKGPGVQHIAWRRTTSSAHRAALRNQGVDFLRVPTTYYEELEARVGKMTSRWRNCGTRHPGGSR
jgi:4-hydroxyphenylpyruvate dioxygenase